MRSTVWSSRTAPSKVRLPRELPWAADGAPRRGEGCRAGRGWPRNFGLTLGCPKTGPSEASHVVSGRRLNRAGLRALAVSRPALGPRSPRVCPAVSTLRRKATAAKTHLRGTLPSWHLICHANVDSHETGALPVATVREESGGPGDGNCPGKPAQIEYATRVSQDFIEMEPSVRAFSVHLRAVRSLPAISYHELTRPKSLLCCRIPRYFSISGLN